MNTAEGVNNDRRRFLTASAAVVGAVGTAFTAVPFIAAWSPSERAKAAGAPVEADISKIELGSRIIVEWRSKPVWLVNRSPDMMATLTEVVDELADPDSEEKQQPEYAMNEARARDTRSELLVMVGICTHLGCSPTFRPEAGSVDADWKGGFFCPCHGSKFDLAGRVYSGVPAPTNMVVPPYKFLSESVILIGDDSEEAA